MVRDTLVISGRECSTKHSWVGEAWLIPPLRSFSNESRSNTFHGPSLKMKAPRYVQSSITNGKHPVDIRNRSGLLRRPMRSSQAMSRTCSGWIFTSSAASSVRSQAIRGWISLRRCGVRYVILQELYELWRFEWGAYLWLRWRSHANYITVFRKHWKSQYCAEFSSPQFPGLIVWVRHLCYILRMAC